MSIAPLPRFSKENWLNLHNNHCKSIITSNYSTLLIGDSLINGLSRYTNTWKRYLKPLDAINCGIGGDRVQNILWRCVNLPKSPSIRNAIILCGTSNIQYDTTEDIVDGILEIAFFLRSKYHLIHVAICGLIPRDDIWSINRIYINEINNDLLYKCKQNGFTFIDQKDWTLQDASLKPNLFYVDKSHLVEDGNAKLAESIVNAINTNVNNYKHATTFSVLLSNTKKFHFNQEDFPPLSCNLFVRNAVCNPVKPVVKWCSNTLVTSKSVNCHNVRLTVNLFVLVMLTIVNLFVPATLIIVNLFVLVMIIIVNLFVLIMLIIVNLFALATLIIVNLFVLVTLFVVNPLELVMFAKVNKLFKMLILIKLYFLLMSVNPIVKIIV